MFFITDGLGENPSLKGGISGVNDMNTSAGTDDNPYYKRGRHSSRYVRKSLDVLFLLSASDVLLEFGNPDISIRGAWPMLGTL